MSGLTENIPLSRRRLVIGALSAVSACAVRPLTPPLAELYASGARSGTPLIVIPGAFGTRLRRRSVGEELWPGTNRSLAFSNYADLALPIDPETLEPGADDVETSGLMLSAFGRDFYRSLVATLETVGGYQRGSTETSAEISESAYYVYEYDWRLDMVSVVRGLHELVERVAAIHGDAGQQVDILAHSSGGLLARYYARYGVTDVLEDSTSKPDFTGSRRIRRLLLAGTPNRGTLQAVLSHIRGEEVGLRHIPEEVVATCPSAAQLMPHPDHSCLLDQRGDPLPFDLYDIDSWRELGWSLFSDEAQKRVRRHHASTLSAAGYLETLEAFLSRQLERGRRFHASLEAAPASEEPRTFVFGGDCLPTLSRLVASPGRRGYRSHQNPNRIPGSTRSVDFRMLMNEPGDGEITRSSLMGRARTVDGTETDRMSMEHAVFICGRHRTLMGNPGLQDNILYTLLEPDQDASTIRAMPRRFT